MYGERQYVCSVPQYLYVLKVIYIDRLILFYADGWNVAVIELCTVYMVTGNDDKSVF